MQETGLGAGSYAVVTLALGALIAPIVGATQVRSALADEMADEASTDRWIGELQSDSFIQRDFAMRKLRRLGERVVPRVEKVARDQDKAAASAAVHLLELLALEEDATAAKAHRALAALRVDDFPIGEPLAIQVHTALRSADRRAAGIVTAMGGTIGRDSSANITSVRINDPQFGDEQARTLTRLVTLKQLDLRKTRVTDASLRSLATLPALEHLNLSDTDVTAPGLRELAPLATLKQLDLYRIEITQSDRHWLALTLPACAVRPESR